MCALFEIAPTAFEEKCCDHGNVEHTDAGGDEVCRAVDVVVGDRADGGKTDETEAEFASFEQDDHAEQGDDLGGEYCHKVA